MAAALLPGPAGLSIDAVRPSRGRVQALINDLAPA
jgi:hypothetical protein